MNQYDVTFTDKNNESRKVVTWTHVDSEPPPVKFWEAQVVTEKLNVRSEINLASAYDVGDLKLGDKVKVIQDSATTALGYLWWKIHEGMVINPQGQRVNGAGLWFASGTTIQTERYAHIFDDVLQKTLGADASKYQPKIYFPDANRDLYFMFIRGGHGLTVDPLYEVHALGANTYDEMNLRVGAYWYNSVEVDPHAQAKMYVKTCMGLVDNMWAADYESAFNPRLPTRDEVYSFLNYLEDYSGCLPIFYSNAPYIAKLISQSGDWSFLKRHPLWLANYSTLNPAVPSPWDSIMFHQWIGDADGAKYGVTDDAGNAKPIPLDHFWGSKQQLVTLNLKTKEPKPLPDNGDTSGDDDEYYYGVVIPEYNPQIEVTYKGRYYERFDWDGLGVGRWNFGTNGFGFAHAFAGNEPYYTAVGNDFKAIAEDVAKMNAPDWKHHPYTNGTEQPLGLHTLRLILANTRVVDQDGNNTIEVQVDNLIRFMRFLSSNFRASDGTQYIVLDLVAMDTFNVDAHSQHVLRQYVQAGYHTYNGKLNTRFWHEKAYEDWLFKLLSELFRRLDAEPNLWDVLFRISPINEVSLDATPSINDIETFIEGYHAIGRYIWTHSKGRWHIGTGWRTSWDICQDVITQRAFNDTFFDVNSDGRLFTTQECHPYCNEPHLVTQLIPTKMFGEWNRMKEDIDAAHRHHRIMVYGEGGTYHEGYVAGVPARDELWKAAVEYLMVVEGGALYENWGFQVRTTTDQRRGNNRVGYTTVGTKNNQPYLFNSTFGVLKATSDMTAWAFSAT